MFARFGISLVAPAAIIALAPAAWAQSAAQTAPFHGVVTTDKAALRCDANDIAYRLGELPTGQILVVTGESDGWYAVAYPAKLTAFVNATEVTVTGDTATLTRPSRLKAANMVSGYSGSWKALMADTLPAGTTLEVIEPAREGSGPIVGYRVKPPAGARAYIQTRVVRPASEADLAAFRSAGNVVPALPGQPAAAPAQPAQTPPGNSTPQGTTPQGMTPSGDEQPREMPPTDPSAPVISPNQPSSQPSNQTPASTTPPPVDLREPMQPTGQPANQPAESPAAEPATEAPAAQPEQPRVIDQTPRATPGEQPTAQPVPAGEGQAAAARRIASLEELEAAFRDVWQQPVLTAEYDELIAEYNRAIEPLDPQTQQRLRTQLERRRDALKLRQDFRETVRRQEEAKAALDSSRQRIADRMKEVEATRVYTIVGQIQPSTVYDGRRLPRMFRVVSVGGAPRTLGYLRETPRFELDRMVGEVVGVVGDAQLDPSLRLNIISPVRIDRLEAERGGQ